MCIILGTYTWQLKNREAVVTQCTWVLARAYMLRLLHSRHKHDNSHHWLYNSKFLDTSVCGGSWCLDPSLSPFLVKFTQILESILLDNPHKAAVLLVGCESFSSTFFLLLNFLLTCLDTALCEQPASLAINFCVLPSLWRVSMIVFWTTFRSAVFPMIV